jgi:uncharacterized protein (TIRG00374 family)
VNNGGKGFRRIGGLLAGAGLIASILVVIIIVGDFNEMHILWDDFQWQYLIWVAFLALMNHGLRYWRWDLLLRRVSSQDFKRATAFLLFSAGSLLILTPARVGEVAKSVYARDFFSIPMAISLPILVVERLADFLVMSLMASIGLLLIGNTTNLLLAGIVLAVTLALFILWRPLLNRVSNSRFGGGGAESRLGGIISLANASQRSLLVPRTLGISLGMGACAWGTEVVIYYLILSAAGAPLDYHYFLVALAIFPLASLGGSLSFLPGGLGATEGGLVALGVLVGGLTTETAVVAALLSRAVILGTVILMGLLSLVFLHRLPRPQQATSC